MGTDGFGSSIVIALAALLWLAYLVPTWFRRREYLSTERNAVRLQQTLRIMAETAEVPETVRVENSVRGVVHQERLLKKELQRQDAIARAQAAANDRAAAKAAATEFERSQAARAAATTVAAPSEVVATVMVPLATRRLRRTRGIVSLVLLASLVGAGFGVAQLLASTSWVLLAGAGFGAVTSIALLARLATIGRARATIVRVPQAQAPQAQAWVDHAGPAKAEDTGWMPVPVPKPLYLSRPQVERAVAASLEAAAGLRQAAAESERALREAQEAGEVTPIRRPAPVAAPARPSRFASMGYVETAGSGTPDVDAVLARRRASAAS
jgi:hypothetical protein